MCKVFLSYSRRNQAFVEELYNRLTRDGVTCFFDKESIQWGANWMRELEIGIQEADIIVLILSPDFCQSEWTNIEQYSARLKDPAGLQRRLRPLLLEPCDHIPPFLQTIQTFDISTNAQFEKHYPKICEDLGGTVTQIKEIPIEQSQSCEKNHYESNIKIHNPIHKPNIIAKGHDQNPYDNRNMLKPDSDMFLGRLQEMTVIRDLIQNAKCVSIVGERRIGKSSLAFRLYHEFKDKDYTIAIYMDCDDFPETLSTKQDFFKLLNDRFKSACQHLNIQYQPDLFECATTFRRFIEKHAQKGFSFILFFDEFERLAQMPCADNTFFSNLRSIANNPLNNMAYVTLSTQELRHLVHHAIQSSKFWNIFHPITLGLMDKSAIKTLRELGFKKNGIKLNQEEFDLIHNFAGDFPFFNQIVCFHLFKSKALQTTINKNQLVNDLMPHYETIWHSRTRQEQQLLKKISHPHMFKHEYLLNDMIVRGIVLKENDFYFIFSQFFNDLIHKTLKLNKNDAWGNGVTRFMSKTKEVLSTIKAIKDVTQ